MGSPVLRRADSVPASTKPLLALWVTWHHKFLRNNLTKDQMSIYLLWVSYYFACEQAILHSDAQTKKTATIAHSLTSVLKFFGNLMHVNKTLTFLARISKHCSRKCGSTYLSSVSVLRTSLHMPGSMVQSQLSQKFSKSLRAGNKLTGSEQTKRKKENVSIESWPSNKIQFHSIMALST